jgi:hypothetical protein
MKRVLVRVCVFLLLGAIINIAVAWAFNTRYIGGAGVEFTPGAESEPFTWWMRNAPAGFAPRPAVGFSQCGIGRESVLLAERISDDVNPTFGNNVFRCRYGWPWRSMERARWVDRKARTLLVRNELPLPGWWPWEGRGLSTRPVWPGFAINSVFYAFVLWLLFAALLALRRGRRTKRGLCPQCAYDLRATQSSVCPECGATR